MARNRERKTGSQHEEAARVASDRGESCGSTKKARK